MQLHRLQELPDRVDQPHPHLGQSAVLAGVEATGVFTDNIVEQHVPMSLCHYVTMSLCHDVTMSLCHYVTMSLCYYVTMSLCNYVTMSLGKISELSQAEMYK